MATFEEFLKIDMRVGRIVSVEDFPEAKKPAFKITIDFGKEIGIKKDELPGYAERVLRNPKASKLTKEVILEILEDCYE